MPETEFAEITERARTRGRKASSVEQLQLFQGVLDDAKRAQADGVPFEDFRGPAKRKASLAQRLLLPFRNTVQRAYNAGRFAIMNSAIVKRLRPFRMFDAVLDDRTTRICRPRDGTVLPADNPWWNANWPPLHHNCRSSVRTLTFNEAVRRGGISEGLTGVQTGEGFGSSPAVTTGREFDPKAKNFDPELFRIFQLKNRGR